MSTAMLTAALRFAAAGWPVVPCRPGGKAPLTAHGVKDATTDGATIKAWWLRHPHANIGLATGAPGPDVVDFDVKDGKPGRETYERLRDAGLLAGCHATVATPSGGFHLYYPGSEQGNGSLGRHGVDFRGRGGYVLAPPSLVGGKPYELIGWRSQYDPKVRGVDFAAIRRHLDPPPRFARPGGATAGRRSDPGALIRWVAGQQEGNRNNALHWAACRAVETAAAPRVLAELVAAAVSAGLSEREARQTVESARRRIRGAA